ncbi:MAG: ribonuclease catalytic domain-containing protein [Synechococcus sp.]
MGTEPVEKGTLVEFRLHGDRQLAVVQGTEGKKNLLLAMASGQTQSVHPRQITYVVPGQGYQAQGIARFLSDAEAIADPDSLEIAWEFLLEDNQAVEPPELAEILFSSSEPTSIYAAYQMLCADRVYFKQKGDAFEPRSQSQVDELKHQIEVAERKEREQEEFEARMQEAFTNPGSVMWPPGDRLRLESLERFALYGDEASDKGKAIKLLENLQRRATEESAFQTLVDLGVWSVHENLDLRRSQAPIRFSDDVLAATQGLLDTPPEDRSDRRDLTHLHTYTIDDASTQEIDDGLSVEFLSDNRQRLWIHIADPTRWILPGSTLDLEARRRATTIYLPDTVIPMFPFELAAGPMSLRQGEVSCALSFGVVLDADGAVEDVEICSSHIKVSYRLTYEDADEMLAMGVEKELTAIAEAAQLRYRWRVDRGAIDIGLPDQDIKVADGVPSIGVIDDTPSRQMVAEMMVLSGAAAARFCADREIAVPYRTQPAPELPSDDELALFGNGHARSFAIMRCMKKGEVATAPDRHAGLGLDAYSQVTSPIRRYSDLIAHFQIKAALSELDPPFDSTQLKESVSSLGIAAAEAVTIERQANRYWSLEYLRLHPDEVWNSLVLGHLREHENLALVMLDEIALRIPVRFQRHVDPGEWVQLAVTGVDPRRDRVDFDEVNTGEDTQ